MKKKLFFLIKILTFNIRRKTSGQHFILASVVKNANPHLIFGKNDVRPTSSRGDSISAPAGLKAVIFSLHFDVRAFAFHRVRGAQIVKSGQ